MTLRQMTRITRFYRRTPASAEIEGDYTEYPDAARPELKLTIPAGSMYERCPKAKRAFIANVVVPGDHGDEQAQLTVVFKTNGEINYIQVRHYTVGRSTSMPRTNTGSWMRGSKLA